LKGSKKEKIVISQSIVEALRSADPPARFLAEDEKTGFYHDVGNAKAYEKTSQTLREGAAAARRHEQNAKVGDKEATSTLPLRDGADALTQLSAISSKKRKKLLAMKAVDLTSLDAFFYAILEEHAKGMKRGPKKDLIAKIHEMKHSTAKPTNTKSSDTEVFTNSITSPLMKPHTPHATVSPDTDRGVPSCEGNGTSFNSFGGAASEQADCTHVLSQCMLPSLSSGYKRKDAPIHEVSCWAPERKRHPGTSFSNLVPSNRANSTATLARSLISDGQLPPLPPQYFTGTGQSYPSVQTHTNGVDYERLAQDLPSYLMSQADHGRLVAPCYPQEVTSSLLPVQTQTGDIHQDLLRVLMTHIGSPSANRRETSLVPEEFSQLQAPLPPFHTQSRGNRELSTQNLAALLTSLSGNPEETAPLYASFANNASSITPPQTLRGSTEFERFMVEALAQELYNYVFGAR